MRPFHLAFPVDNLDKTREFYTAILGCKEGRSSDSWIDFDMYGHQVVAHLVDELAGLSKLIQLMEIMSQPAILE